MLEYGGKFEMVKNLFCIIENISDSNLSNNYQKVINFFMEDWNSAQIHSIQSIR